MIPIVQYCAMVNASGSDVLLAGPGGGPTTMAMPYVNHEGPVADAYVIVGSTMGGSTGFTLYKSSDNGATWSAVSTPITLDGTAALGDVVHLPIKPGTRAKPGDLLKVTMAGTGAPSDWCMVAEVP